MKKTLGMVLLGAGGILAVGVLRNVAQILSADEAAYTGRLSGHLMWQAVLVAVVFLLFRFSFRLLGPSLRRKISGPAARRLAGSFPERAKMRRA